MYIGKGILFGSISVIGSCLPMIVGAYYKNYKNIWDVVKNKALPNQDSLNDDWKLLKSNLSSIEGELKDPQLKEIAKSSQENDNSLREWCSKAYLVTYKSWLQNANESLLSDVEKSCVLTIKIKLGANSLNIEDNNAKNDFKTNLSSLKTYNSGYLDDILKKLQEKIKNANDIKTSEEKHWEELKKWCGEAYKKSYQGIESHVWELSEKFCKKPTPQ